MGLPSTIHRFQIQLADTGRGVYESLDLRVARHPSETVPFLLTRILAYCLAFEPGIAFSSGLCEPDEPALWVKDLTGRLTAWIEVGMPAPERLHKATKAVDRVIVFPHRPVELFLRQCEGARIYKSGSICVVALEPAFLRALEPTLDRNARWDVSIHDGHLFLTVGGQAFGSTVEEHRLETA
jgi:uncharacterized protein YaeQ